MKDLILMGLWERVLPCFISFVGQKIGRSSSFLHKKIEGSFLNIDELYNIISIRNSINTKDEFYDSELKIFYENMPRFDELKHRRGTIGIENKIS